MGKDEDGPEGVSPGLRSPYIGFYKGQADALEAERQRLADWRHRWGEKHFPLRLKILVLALAIAGLCLIAFFA